jgi:hypothetical protein
MSRNSLAIDSRWMVGYDEPSRKPGLSRGFLNALMLCFPLSSVIWAGIIYAAARLVR